MDDQEDDGSLVEGEASAIDQALHRRVRALAASATTVPVVRDIQRAARAIRGTKEYRQFVHVGTAVEMRKLTQRMFGVVDHKGRWVTLDEMNKVDAEGYRRLSHFLKGFEDLVAETAADLRADWTRELVLEAAAILADALRERLSIVLRREVPEDGAA